MLLKGGGVGLHGAQRGEVAVEKDGLVAFGKLDERQQDRVLESGRLTAWAEDKHSGCAHGRTQHLLLV
jgi:hypothetical protein